MEIAIISDTHDNLANLERFLMVAEELGIDGIIHCGDVTTPETLDWLAEKFPGPIKLACGNMEIRCEEFAEIAKRQPNLEVFPEIGEWKLASSKVGPQKSRACLDLAFAHKPGKAKELAGYRDGRGKPQYNFVFYGHTHKPWIKLAPEDSPLGAFQGGSSGGAIMANPGTLGGVFTSPTFAVLDTDSGRLELKKLYQ